jgi:ubiquinone/menaquinone biosynthesis C-methylase UbiE
MENESKTWVTLWNSKQLKNFIHLVGMIARIRNVPRNAVTSVLRTCMFAGLNDRTTVEKLLSLCEKHERKKTHKTVKYVDNSYRGKQRGKDVVNILSTCEKDKNDIKSYIDIGAGDGVITKYVAEAVGVNSSNTHAVDIEEWSGGANVVPKGVSDVVNFTYLDEKAIKLPLDDESVDLVTAFQVLHHVKPLSDMMGEISRVCKPAGIVIIREHNASDTLIKMLIDVEHTIYSIFSDGLSVDSFIKMYYASYKSISKWDSLFKDLGMSRVFLNTNVKKFNTTKYYYAAYQKSTK